MTSSLEERIKAISLTCHDFRHGIKFDCEDRLDDIFIGKATSSFAHIEFETAVLYRNWLLVLDKPASSKITWIVSAYREGVRYCLATVDDNNADDRNDKFIDFIMNKVCY